MVDGIVVAVVVEDDVGDGYDDAGGDDVTLTVVWMTMMMVMTVM